MVLRVMIIAMSLADVAPAKAQEVHDCTFDLSTSGRSGSFLPGKVRVDLKTGETAQVTAPLGPGFFDQPVEAQRSSPYSGREEITWSFRNIPSNRSSRITASYVMRLSENATRASIAATLHGFGTQLRAQGRCAPLSR